MTAPLLAVDTPWLLYRSFFALPRTIKGADGGPVNALLGTVNAILGAVAWCAPRAVVCCFGAEDATHRVAAFPAYHAHRDPMPGELAPQWQRAPELLGALGWHVATHERLEADDLLGAYAMLERQAGGRTLILSADRDMQQCVDEATQVVELRRDQPPQPVGAEEVERRHGVAPAQIPDLIALRGDPSDGIPGARGVGPKTAAALLAEHGSLEGVLAAGPELSAKLRATLAAQADELRTFKRIATLEPVDVRRPPDAATDRTAGAQKARELGLKRLAARLTA